MLEAPLAAVSSSGRRVSDGIQAICAGRNTQPMRESTVAMTMIDSGRRVDDERDGRDDGEHGAEQVARR